MTDVELECYKALQNVNVEILQKLYIGENIPLVTLRRNGDAVSNALNNFGMPVSMISGDPQAKETIRPDTAEGK